MAHSFVGLYSLLTQKLCNPLAHKFATFRDKYPLAFVNNCGTSNVEMYNFSNYLRIMKGILLFSQFEK